MPDIDFIITSFTIGVILFELLGGLPFSVGRVCVADGGEI